VEFEGARQVIHRLTVRTLQGLPGTLQVAMNAPPVHDADHTT
jgi:hypothetical protein